MLLHYTMIVCLKHLITAYSPESPLPIKSYPVIGVFKINPIPAGKNSDGRHRLNLSY